MSTRLDEVSLAAIERSKRHVADLQKSLKLIAPPTSDVVSHFDIGRACRLALRGNRAAEDCEYELFSRDEYIRSGITPASEFTALIPPVAFYRALLGHGRRTLQGYETTLATAGAELVGTDFLGDELIDALRPRSRLLQAGVRRINELKGDVQVPRMDSTSTPTWLTTSGSSPVVSGAISESEGSFDSSPITAAPCQIGGLGKISRLLLQQSPLASYVIANDGARTLGTGVDVVGLQGTGSSGQPSGVTVVSGTNGVAGASFALSTAVTAAADISNANGIINPATLAWITTPTVAALPQQRMKVATYSYSPIWEGSIDQGSILGNRAFSTTNVPSGVAVYGDWSQLLLLQWGPDRPIAIEFNPFNGNYAGGDVMYRILMSANFVVRHPQSFSVVTSIT